MKYTKILHFNTFLESMKQYNPSLIESIQKGFKICFENNTNNIGYVQGFNFSDMDEKTYKNNLTLDGDYFIGAFGNYIQQAKNAGMDIKPIIKNNVLFNNQNFNSTVSGLFNYTDNNKINASVLTDISQVYPNEMINYVNNGYPTELQIKYIPQDILVKANYHENQTEKELSDLHDEGIQNRLNKNPRLHDRVTRMEEDRFAKLRNKS